MTDRTQEQASHHRGRPVVAHNHSTGPGGLPLLVFGSPGERTVVYDQSFSTRIGNATSITSAGVTATITPNTVRVDYGAVTFHVSPQLWSSLQARSSPQGEGKARSLTVYDVKALMKTDPVFKRHSDSTNTVENCAPIAVRYYGPSLQV